MATQRQIDIDDSEVLYLVYMAVSIPHLVV
jgi:hypothetical protein